MIHDITLSTERYRKQRDFRNANVNSGQKQNRQIGRLNRNPTTETVNNPDDLMEENEISAK